MQVLLIGDCRDDLAELRRSLETMDDLHVLGTIAEAEEAQMLLEQSQEPDDFLVIKFLGSALDCTQVCRKLKRLLPLAKILVVSKGDAKPDVIEALTSGANGLMLQKEDWGIRYELQSAVLSVYNGNMWIDAALAPHMVQTLNDLKTLRPNISTASPGHDPLSQREREVLQLVVNGLSNQQIARNLDVSLETVKSHVKNILDKLDVNDRTQAAIKAVREGLL